MSDRRVLLLGMLLVALALIVLVLAVYRGRQRGVAHGIGALGLVGVGVAWMLVNEPIEGDVLLEVARDHGITYADLPAFVLFAAAAVLAIWR